MWSAKLPVGAASVLTSNGGISPALPHVARVTESSDFLECSEALWGDADFVDPPPESLGCALVLLCLRRGFASADSAGLDGMGGRDGPATSRAAQDCSPASFSRGGQFVAMSTPGLLAPQWASPLPRGVDAGAIGEFPFVFSLGDFFFSRKAFFFLCTAGATV